MDLAMLPTRGAAPAALQLDPAERRFHRGDADVVLTPKAFALLHALFARAGRLVTKAELLAEVWSGAVVGDAVLKVAMNEIRRALGDDAKQPRYIATEHRRGYRYIGPVATNGAAAVAAATPVPPAARPAPAGRRSQLAAVDEALAFVARGERQVFFVAGEAGIGKTMLVDAFVAGLPRELAARVGSGECLEHFGPREPYQPFFEALERLACGELRADLVAALRRCAPTWLVHLPALLRPGERTSLESSLLGASRERMVRELGEALDLLSASAPLVLVIEDLHWADGSTLDLVASLARRGTPGRLLLIATWRPVEAILSKTPVRILKDSLVAAHRARELVLDLLDVDGTAELLAARFPGVEIPREVAQRVHARCEGHPLFLVHVVDWMVVRSRLIVRANRLEMVEGDGVGPGLPDNLQQMLTRELERLDPFQVAALEVASVAGFDFSAATVAVGLECDVVPVETALEVLVRSGQYLRSRGTMEWPDGTISASYEFRHALYRNFLYQRVAPARRVQLHRRIGERGEQVFGARVAEIAATLAIHFEQGRDLVRAVKYLHLEASNDARRFAPRAAVAALERALELAAKLPADLAPDAESSLRRELERMRKFAADAEPASEPTGQNAP